MGCGLGTLPELVKKKKRARIQLTVAGGLQDGLKTIPPQKAACHLGEPSTDDSNDVSPKWRKSILGNMQKDCCLGPAAFLGGCVILCSRDPAPPPPTPGEGQARCDSMRETAEVPPCAPDLINKTRSDVTTHFCSLHSTFWLIFASPQTVGPWKLCTRGSAQELCSPLSLSPAPLLIDKGEPLTFLCKLGSLLEPSTEGFQGGDPSQ